MKRNKLNNNGRLMKSFFKQKAKTIFIMVVIIILCKQTNAQDTIITSIFKPLIVTNNLTEMEYKDSLKSYDFGKLWTETRNAMVHGFIGKDYQRIRIKIIKAIKDKNNSDKYNIIGKSMVKDNINVFNGTIIITSVRLLKEMHYGVDDDYKNIGIKKEGVLVAKYHFVEDSTQKHSGIFEGTLATLWYIDKNGKLIYDSIEFHSDPYCNNQFAGTWKDYKSNITLTCNWGDYRIPFSGDLDIGAGEFSVNEKYIKNGWENCMKATGWSEKNRREGMQAIKIEEMKWWK